MFSTRKMAVYVSWFFAFLWMVFIFHLSSQPATHSNELSLGITETVIETAEKVVPHLSFNKEEINHFVRKNAHFFAYLTLALLLSNALKRSGKSGWKRWTTAFIICVLYATSDEIHQIFVPGRGPQVKDVFIDSSGALVGIGLYWLTKKSRIFKKKNRNTRINKA